MPPVCLEASRHGSICPALRISLDRVRVGCGYPLVFNRFGTPPFIAVHTGYYNRILFSYIAVAA